MSYLSRDRQGDRVGVAGVGKVVTFIDARTGQVYERAAIEGWFAEHDTSPLTGASLPSKLLVPNLPLRQLILAHAAAGSGEQ